MTRDKAGVIFCGPPQSVQIYLDHPVHTSALKKTKNSCNLTELSKKQKGRVENLWRVCLHDEMCVRSIRQKSLADLFKWPLSLPGGNLGEGQPLLGRLPPSSSPALTHGATRMAKLRNLEKKTSRKREKKEVEGLLLSCSGLLLLLLHGPSL